MASAEFQSEVLACKRRMVLEAMEQAAGRTGYAARQLGMHRNTLLRLLKELQFDATAIRERYQVRKRPALPLHRRVRLMPRCPDCGSGRCRESVVGVGQVRCQDCYKLYAASAGEGQR